MSAPKSKHETKKTTNIVTATGKITAVQILRHLQKLHAGATPPWVFYHEVKSGPSWGQRTPWSTRGQDLYIMDAIAIKKSWSNPCIEGYEIKVSRSDFLRDKKWQNYQAYCHKFYFVCPPNIITLDDLPSPEHGDVGLLYYSPEHDTLFTKRRAMYRKIDIQSKEVVGMLLYLAMYRASAGAAESVDGMESAETEADGEQS